MALDMNNLEQFTTQGTTYFRDPSSGDVYSAQEQSPFDEFGEPRQTTFLPNRLIAYGSEVKNPDFANLTESYNWRGPYNAGEKYTDPYYAINLSNLKQENPNEYYKILATDISDQIANNWSLNKNEHNAALTKQLESIEEINPAAYYQAQFNLLSKQSGWQHGQNTFDRAKPYQEKMAELAPKALEAGVTPQQIDAIVGSGFSASSTQNQQRIANEMQRGGSGFKLSELLRGVAPIAAFAIGAPYLDAALAAGAAGGSAGAGGSYAGINFGGAFTPVAGSGASFTLPAAAAAGAGAGAGAIATEAGQTAFFNALASGATSAEALSAGLSVEALASGTASFLTPELMGPTYGELGITGIEGGLAGPSYAELGYTGLNNAEAIAAADAASKGFSAKDVLSNANRAQKLAKLLSPSGSQATRKMMPRNLPFGNQMAQQATQQPVLEQFGGLYRMNQNPFTFATQGQTVAGPNMYDVSGSNPMANALRKS
jgi:hypothetical protein